MSPEVDVIGGDFLYLSAPRPIVAPGTPFLPDLQAWIRNSNLKPDWLRIGTDIIDGSPSPTFNMTFSLTGDAIPKAGRQVAQIVMARVSLRWPPSSAALVQLPQPWAFPVSRRSRTDCGPFAGNRGGIYVSPGRSRSARVAKWTRGEEPTLD